MRVVFLTHNYPRWPGDLSGWFLQLLANALVARGAQVVVVAPSDAGKGGDAVEGGIRVRRVRYAAPERETLAYRGTMQAAARSVGGLQTLAQLRRALRRAAAEEARRADLIHAHWWIPAGLAVPVGAPFVLTSHGTDAALLRRSSIARTLARPVYRRARVVTAVSRELARWISDSVGRPLAERHVHPMPTVTDRFRWSRGGGGLVVIARLTAQKRVHLALNAVAELERSGRRLPLTIAGDGPERARLEARAAELGIAERTRFLGAVDPRDVPMLLEAADLMLFPAEGEGFGLVAAESLMAGVPVIACEDGGGVLDIVPASGAGRRAAPSGAAIAAAVTGMLDDPACCDLAREAGKEWRIRLAPDRVAAVCAGWYREALGAQAGAGA